MGNGQSKIAECNSKLGMKWSGLTDVVVRSATVAFIINAVSGAYPYVFALTAFVGAVVGAYVGVKYSKAHSQARRYRLITLYTATGVATSVIICWLMHNPFS